MPCRSILIAALPALLWSGCGSSAPAPEVELPLEPGPWHLSFELGTPETGAPAPVQAELHQVNGTWTMAFHNQEETVLSDTVAITGDSIRIHMPIFDTEFVGRISGKGAISGIWRDAFMAPDAAIAFTAQAGERPRFNQGNKPVAHAISGEWETWIMRNNDPNNTRPAIGMFQVEQGGRATGSFATQSGDLRYLDGVVDGDSLFLSTFNGAQAVLVRAAITADSLIGEIRTSPRSATGWYAVRNPGFTLADARSISEIVPDEPVTFSFPDQDDNLRSISDEQFKGKVVVMEMMGTWCPNCLDGSRLLKEMHEKYNGQGLEVVGLAFERHRGKERALEALRQYKQKVELPYDLLYAGMLNNDTVVKKLPFLKQVRAYPTTFVVGRDGRLVQVFTGIDGPGTGDRYTLFKEHLEETIQGALTGSVMP